MSLPNTHNIQIPENETLASNWYEAILLGHIEKDNQAETFSHIEFDVTGQNRHIWAILSHNENSLDKIKRLKQALKMTDDEVDLKPHYNTNLRIYINRIIKDGKFQNEVIDFESGDDCQGTKQAKSGTEIPQRILIVDDQMEVANLIGNYVQKVGFAAVIVCSVDEAIERIEHDDYLMVISDVIMPGKNGFDLVRYVHNKCPQLSVALMSGYIDKEMESLQGVFGIDKIYRKPVFFQAVKEMIISSIKKLKAEST